MPGTGNLQLPRYNQVDKKSMQLLHTSGEATQVAVKFEFVFLLQTG